MNSNPYLKISSCGEVTLLPEAPSPDNKAKPDYSKKPVQFSIRQSPLGLDLHGKNFKASIDLDMEDALSIVLMLTYGIREKAACDSAALVRLSEASK